MKNETRIKTKSGVVVSDKMQKTVAVLVERLVMHPVFKKYLRVSKKFLAHDEKGECKTGDTVLIRETRPLSKRKSWKVVKILKQGEGHDVLLKEGVGLEDKGRKTLKREPGVEL